MTPRIREALPQDLPLIRSSWHLSYLRSYANKRIPWTIYRPGQEARIARLMSRSLLHVAYLDEVPDEILGWSAVDGEVLHYIYVRGIYRRKGIGSALVPEGTKYYTHQTNTAGGRFLAVHKLVFNPYQLEQL